MLRLVPGRWHRTRNLVARYSETSVTPPASTLGATLENRTELTSDVVNRLFTKSELSAIYAYVDLLVSSRFSIICHKITKFKNRISILLAHNITLFIEMKLLTF